MHFLNQYHSHFLPIQNPFPVVPASSSSYEIPSPAAAAEAILFEQQILPFVDQRVPSIFMFNFNNLY